MSDDEAREPGGPVHSIFTSHDPRTYVALESITLNIHTYNNDAGFTETISLHLDIRARLGRLRDLGYASTSPAFIDGITHRVRRTEILYTAYEADKNAP